MSEVEKKLPENNLPGYMFTDREIKELERKYSFDELRKQIINKDYGEWQDQYYQYFERSRGMLRDDLHQKGLADIETSIDAWASYIKKYDEEFFKHIQKESSENTGKTPSDIDNFDQICKSWIIYIIQRDP